MFIATSCLEATVFERAKSMFKELRHIYFYTLSLPCLMATTGPRFAELLQCWVQTADLSHTERAGPVVRGSGEL